MISAAVITREEFVAWVSKRRAEIARLSEPSQLRSKIGKGRYGVVWQSDDLFDQDSNPIFVVRREDVDDFFAFASTYIQDYRPFSAFYRVSTPENLDREISSPRERILPDQMAARLVGVSIAEAFVRSAGRIASAEEMPLTAVGATVAMALAATVAHGYDSGLIFEVARRWVVVNKLLGEAENSPLVSTAIEIFHAASLSMHGKHRAPPDGPVSRAAIIAQHLSVDETFSEHGWRLLTEGWPELTASFAGLRGPREDRIKTFDRCSNFLRQNIKPQDESLADCIGGCALALVAEGSFQYMQLSRVFLPDMPGAILWFGFWSSLFKSSDILTIGNCLGRRAARDYLAPHNIFDRPKDDIAFDEFDVIGLTAIKELRSAANGVLSIELLPGISGKFKLTKASRDAQYPADNKTIVAAGELSELRFLLDRADSALRRIESVLMPTSEVEARKPRSPRRPR